MRAVDRPSAEDLRAAAAAVAGALAPTPLVQCHDLGVQLKLESLQPTGAFKVRGAVAALARTPAGARVVTASAGNHALAMVWAARRSGHQVSVYVSKAAAQPKLEVLAEWGADVHQVGTSYDEAEQAALEDAAGAAVYVSAYNDTGVMAGTATIGAELEGVDTIVVPLGGGGLMAGLCTWAAQRPVRLVGVELGGWRQWSQAIEAGEVVQVEGSDSLADGVAGNNEPGSATFDVLRGRMDELVAVDEQEIRDAIRFLATRCGVVAEGAGAMATAALLAGTVAAQGRTVALVTGRNIKPATLARILH